MEELDKDEMDEIRKSISNYSAVIMDLEKNNSMKKSSDEFDRIMKESSYTIEYGKN